MDEIRPVQPYMPDQCKMRPREEEAVIQIDEREWGRERENVRAVKRWKGFAVDCVAGPE